jgi:hypothetical protein
MNAGILLFVMVSATFPDAMQAAIVMLPPVSALPMHMMSGFIPACIIANLGPVR